MKRSCPHHGLAGALAFGALLAAANAAEPATTPEEPQHVEIQAQLPSHEEHPYADLLDAMTQFDAWHATHPGTRLVFQVRPRKDAAVRDGLRLGIDDPVTHGSTPVDVGADGSFTLPVSAELRSHAAVVRANRTNGSLAWTVRVIHEADDPHVRRLGDLREECHLDLYAATLARGVKTPSFYALKAAGNVCASRLVGFPAYADHPVFAVQLRDGERRGFLRGDLVHDGEVSVVPLAALFDWAYLLRDCTYFTHELMADSSWSDDTILHLTFADDPADPPQAVAAGVAP
jgi:hypothetical protein